MARPHIFFLQSQSLPWRRATLAGRRGLRTKVLSRDDATGAATMIIRYPPGFAWDGPGALAADEEFFVLDGALAIDGHEHGPHVYALLPAGYTRHSMASAQGATVLTMLSAAPRLARGKSVSFDARKLIAPIDTLAMRWDASLVDPGLPPGAAIKPLRTDPDTGEITLLYAAMAQRVSAGMVRPRWTHPMVEEIFLIAGDEDWTGNGLAGPGAYFWWREHVWHGPSGSLTGYLMLVRTHGGPLRNIFAPEPSPLVFGTPYTPVLPPDLAKRARPWRKPPQY